MFTNLLGQAQNRADTGHQNSYNSQYVTSQPTSRAWRRQRRAIKLARVSLAA